MMMRFCAAGAAAAMLLTSGAQAVTTTSQNGAPDVGPSGDQLLVTFDSAPALGSTVTGFMTAIGSSTFAAAPALDTTRYGYVSTMGSSVATFTSGFDLNRVSFYWGSIDSYNFVDILGAGGITLLTMSGSEIPPANGDQTLPGTNRRVFYSVQGSEVITGIRFRTTGIAFEIDDIAGNAAGNPLPVVPEPATWAMMIAGFGLVGLSARSRRRKIVSVTA